MKLFRTNTDKNTGRNTASPEPAASNSMVADLLYRVATLAGALAAEPVTGTFTYEQAVTYFVRHRPADPRVVKGAILRERRRQHVRVMQLFLDRQSRPVADRHGAPYGRQMLVRALDPELIDAFGDKNLVIFE